MEIKFSSINKNKFINGIKFLCVGTALSLVLSGCNKLNIKTTNTITSTTAQTTNDYIEGENIHTPIMEYFEEESGLNLNIKGIDISNENVSVYNSNFEISEKTKNKINNDIKNYGGDCSFIAINLKDGMCFGYNIDKSYPTASTIKAAVSLYAFKEMDNGNGNLEELKVYEERFRRDGSGVLQNKKSGTSYSLKELFYYTINYSDNVAYYMIHDRFYSDHYNTYLKDLGCDQLYLENGARWGQINARSMAIIWQEIYKYKDETENGKYLFELLTNAEYNYIKEGMENYESAHKSGWTPRETHDSGIVFGPDDYIFVTLNNNNGNYDAKSQLLKISASIEIVIDEYELYKKNNFNKQKQLTK